MFRETNVKKIRRLLAVGIILPWILIGVAYFYFQKELGLAPCPLCMFQRAVLACISFVCLVAWCFGFRSGLALTAQKISSIIVALLAIVGGFIAGRQVWLQNLPPEKVPACGVDPVYMWLESSEYGFMEMLATTLQGSGDCSVVHWSFLGLSIAGWMIVIFVSIFLVAISSFVKSR